MPDPGSAQRRIRRIAPGMTGMTLGSTPSFPALKTLPDWFDRFTAFYALNPHPSFLLVEGISRVRIEE